MRCPNNCDVSNDPYPFYYPPGCLISFDTGGHPELGIMADENGKLSDTWTDGVRGCPGWEDDGCMPHCVACHEEAVHS